VNGEPLDPEKTYRVATNDYLMEGNSGLMLLRRIPENMVVRTGIRLADAVAEYIQDNSPFSVAIDGRWKRDESAQPSAEWLEKFGQ
ncbi:MAG TPA: 5'-nucleotidase C-terminal domain-containing protein, partial [Calditrichia bacterium]|nr:5'-nucleotidase C-terminal domain-containing protein [Calditrichia bacterium]